jgi:hypothetical protein
LAIAGEQGSAKTVLSKLLRALVDPSVAPVRALPRDERELFIAASHSHVLAFDNLSGLPPWLSDTLCRLTSGGAFSTRQLFTDQDEILFVAARSVIRVCSNKRPRRNTSDLESNWYSDEDAAGTSIISASPR